MNRLDTTYQNLLKDILENGKEKSDRTGTGTLSVFGRQIRHKMSEGFPLLTTKKMAWKSIVTELLWFLHGDTNIKYLIDNDCHIWDGDAYKNYTQTKIIKNGDGTETHNSPAGHYSNVSKEEFINKIKTDNEFAKRFGNLGKIYGKQWRSWKFTDKFTNGQQIAYVNGKVDQIANLIRDLKTNPDSRRLMVSAWNVGELDQMVLPPCHYGFQIYTRELTLKDRYEWSIGKIISYDEKDYEKTLRAVNNDESVIHNLLDKHNIPTRAISLMFNMRSNDVPLGLPFNLASYGLLLEIFSKMVNMVPDELIANLGDAHIYLNQIDGVKEQLTRDPYQLPKLVISNQVNFNKGIDEFLNSCLITDFQIEGYQSHPSIKMPLSN